MQFSARTFTGIVGVFLLAMSSVAQAGYDFDENGNAFVTGQAIVAFKPGTTLITIKSILARYGADPSKMLLFDQQTVLVGFNDRKDVLSFCQQMRASGWSHASSPNHLHYLHGIPNDPYYSLQWGLKPGLAGASATVGADFQGASAYVSATIGSGVKVAVIDSGVDLRHPDIGLLNSTPPGPLVPPSGTLYAAMTFTNAQPSSTIHAPPYSFAPGAPWDDLGHGTHVIGIIAAQTGNRVGVAGAAPGSIIYPIKIFDRYAYVNGTTDDLISRAIMFAATNGCRVINMSFGGGTVSFIVTNAIQFAQTQTIDRTVIPNVNFKGVVCVASMGNDGGTVANPPAIIPGVVAVGAHGPNGTRPTYSTTGPWITLAAPGGDLGATANHAGEIFSTYPRYAVSLGPPTIPKPTYTNYSYASGTSMAAPHVSAAAAMLLQKKPLLSQAQVWAQLAMFSTHTAPISTIANPNGSTTQIPDTAFDINLGYGLLNANSLLQAKQPALGSTTGIPHVFPFKPRNQFTYTATSIPIGGITFTGLQNIDVMKGNATNTFRVTVVDDKGERIPTAQVTARFKLLLWPAITLGGYPTSNVVDTPLLDNGTAAQDDLLANDCVYGCKIHFPGSFSNCYYEVKYLVTAPGTTLKPNTNCVVNIWVR
ncbi:MAG: S8 family serine peptidase [Verrucomicrobia bacterium]|nr:S8 family serine peptidase [Verrucomicrobiota bacterium]